MKHFLTVILFLFISTSCTPEHKANFTPEALAQKVYDKEMQITDIQSVLDSLKGKKVIIDVWASWCGDCIKSIPKMEEFQQEHPEVAFVFLSVDDSQDKWHNGLNKHFAKYNIHGEHYFFNTGWDKNGNNAFIDFLELDWIPRYLLLDENGDILVYYAKSIDDNAIAKAIES